jgi:hypothetical protein
VLPGRRYDIGGLCASVSTSVALWACGAIHFRSVRGLGVPKPAIIQRSVWLSSRASICVLASFSPADGCGAERAPRGLGLELVRSVHGV